MISDQSGPGSNIFAADELARMQSAIDAVCAELGITERTGREAVAGGIIRTYTKGCRQPLNLVQAGLSAAGF